MNKNVAIPLQYLCQPYRGHRPIFLTLHTFALCKYGHNSYRYRRSDLKYQFLYECSNSTDVYCTYTSKNTFLVQFQVLPNYPWQSDNGSTDGLDASQVNGLERQPTRCVVSETVSRPNVLIVCSGGKWRLSISRRCPQCQVVLDRCPAATVLGQDFSFCLFSSHAGLGCWRSGR